TVVYGPGTISFWWKASSRRQHDFLRFNMNGVELGRISGQVDWHQQAFDIPAGIQTVEWMYSKQTRGSQGGNAGWMDGLRFTPRGTIAPVITSQPADLSVWRGTSTNLSVLAKGIQSLQYQWYFNGTNLPGRTNAVLSLTNVQARDIGSYRVEVSNSYGTATSSNVLLTLLDGAPQIVVQRADQISNPGR